MVSLEINPGLTSHKHHRTSLSRCIVREETPQPDQLNAHTASLRRELLNTKIPEVHFAVRIVSL